MARGPRHRPERLGAKLRAVRRHLGLNQTEMAARVEGPEQRMFTKYVSNFECGEKEPTLVVLLRYARAAGVSVETLIDDAMNLPQAFGRKAVPK
jgi:transcriptional regulator with XRE-family HTH domain